MSRGVHPLASVTSAFTRKGKQPMVESETALPKLPRRSADSYKNNFGHALLVGGSTGFAGSISLSAMAALRCGAGLVTVATPRACQGIVAGFEPSYMTLALARCRGADLGRRSRAPRRRRREGQRTGLWAGAGAFCGTDRVDCLALSNARQAGGGRRRRPQCIGRATGRTLPTGRSAHSHAASRRIRPAGQNRSLPRRPTSNPGHGPRAPHRRRRAPQGTSHRDCRRRPGGDQHHGQPWHGQRRQRRRADRA